MIKAVVAEADSAAALAAVRELGEAGCLVTAAARVRSHAAPLGLTSSRAERALCWPAVLTESGRREWLLDVLHAARETGEDEKPVFFPAGPDALRLLTKSRGAFALECRFLVPPDDAQAAAQDKRLLARAAAACGVAVPEPVEFPASEPVESFAARLSYPVMLKYWGGEKAGLPAARHYTIVQTPQIFRRRYETMYDVQSPVLIQRVVAGTSFGVGLVMDAESRPVAAVMHERLRQLPPTGGQGTLVRSVWRPDLLGPAVALLRHLRWQGLAMVELVAGEAGAVVVDVNARLWGSFPLGRMCRAGLAEAYVRAARGETLAEIGAACPFETGVVMQNFAADIRTACAMGPAEALDSLRCLFSRKVRGIVRDTSDPRPTAAYVRSFLSPERESGART